MRPRPAPYRRRRRQIQLHTDLPLLVTLSNHHMDMLRQTAPDLDNNLPQRKGDSVTVTSKASVKCRLATIHDSKRSLKMHEVNMSAPVQNEPSLVEVAAATLLVHLVVLRT